MTRAPSPAACLLALAWLATLASCERTETNRVELVPAHSSAAPTPLVTYFYSPGCPECEEVSAAALPEIEMRLGPVRRLNVESEEGFLELGRAESLAGRSVDVMAPVVAYGMRLFAGADEIRRLLADLDVRS